MLILGLQLLGDDGRVLLRYDRAAIESGEVWRLLTGNLVHLGWWHTFLNALGIGILVMLCPEPLSAWVWLRRVVLIGVSMTVCLLLWVPSMHWYVGLSGATHGFFLLGLGRQALQRDLIAWGCLSFLFGKLAWEWVMGVPVSDEQAIGGRVALESHFFGALSGLVYGVVFGAFRRLEPAQPFRKS